MSYAERIGDRNLISISLVSVSNGDCCAKSATGNVMRNERDALGTSAKKGPPKMPVRRNMKLSVAGQVDRTSDPDETVSAGYNPYDHVPATLHNTTDTNRVVKVQLIRTEVE